MLLTDTIGFVSRLPVYDRCIQINLEESLATDLILLLIDCSEDQTGDIRIKNSSCWDVLDKADRSKVFVILSKSDSTQPEKIDEIANALGISNPIVISSKRGYGIHKLKTMTGSHLINLAIDIPNSRKE